MFLNPFQHLGLFLLVSSSSDRDGSTVATRASFSRSSSLEARREGDGDLAASWIHPLPLPFAACFLVLRLGGIMKLCLNWRKIYYPSPQVRHVRSVIVQRTFCPFLKRYICVLSVIHPLLIRQSPLVDLFLSVSCPLHMRYSCVLCAPCTFAEDPHRHRDNFHHRMNTGLTIFAFSLSVRRPLPLSGEMWQHHKVRNNSVISLYFYWNSNVNRDTKVWNISNVILF